MVKKCRILTCAALESDVMLTCGEIELELCAYCDGALAPAERANVESHLAVCPSCKRALADIEGVRAALSGLAKLKAPARIRASIRAEIAGEKPSQKDASKVTSLGWGRWIGMMGVAAALTFSVLGYVTFFQTNVTEKSSTFSVAQKNLRDEKPEDGTSAKASIPMSDAKVAGAVGGSARSYDKDAPVATAEPMAPEALRPFANEKPTESLKESLSKPNVEMPELKRAIPPPMPSAVAAPSPAKPSAGVEKYEAPAQPGGVVTKSAAPKPELAEETQLNPTPISKSKDAAGSGAANAASETGANHVRTIVMHTHDSEALSARIKTKALAEYGAHKFVEVASKGNASEANVKTFMLEIDANRLESVMTDLKTLQTTIAEPEAPMPVRPAPPQKSPELTSDGAKKQPAPTVTPRATIRIEIVVEK